MNLNDYARKAFETAQAHGFHDEPHDFSHWMALMVSELAEALEAHRTGNIYEGESPLACFDSGLSKTSQRQRFENAVKDSYQDELADVLIRIFDYCGMMNIDIESHVQAKMQYNKLRPYRHGKRY